MIFIGYPLEKIHKKEQTEEILHTIVKRFKPESVAVISPFYIIPQEKCIQKGSDFYYRLDLSSFTLTSSLKNSIKRASREVNIEQNKVMTEEHIKLIDEFIASHKIDEYTQFIFKKIPYYMNFSNTVTVFNARNKEDILIGFDIADYGGEDYAFYMFNFISHKYYIPGVSDLLLYKIIETAKEKGKLYINLGLGINEGVEFFKRKWSGKPFLQYEFCFYKISHKFSILKFLKNFCFC